MTRFVSSALSFARRRGYGGRVRWWSLAAALALTGCGSAGGPSGRYVAARPDAGSSPDGGGAPDAGTAGPTCPQPDLAEIRRLTFLPHCAISGCHDTSTTAAGLDLSSPLADLRALLAGTSSQSPSRMRLIQPGQIGQSYLYLKVFLPAPVAGERMPPGAPLPQCHLEALQTWIADGAR